MKLRVYLTFTAENAREPIVWKLGKDFDVVTNIRTAEIREGMGLMGLEINGETEVIEAAISWLESQGVHVEPIEQSVIAG